MKSVKRWFKKYFVPHPENDHKPHFLRHKSMMYVLLFVLIIELGFLAQVFIVFNKTNFLAAVLPSVLTDLTNQDRAQNDAPPLTENSVLDTAAQMKADDMAAKGYFAHTSPDGKSPWYWFEQAGYSFSAAGENLAVNFFESSDVAEAWMNSPTHRANVVNKNFKEIGIGVANGVYQGKNTVFVAELFGTPLFASANSNATQTPTPTPVTTTTAPAPTPKPAPKPTPKPTTKPTPQPKIIPTRTITPIVRSNKISLAPTPRQTQVLGEQEVTSTNSIKSFIQRVLTSPRTSATYAYSLVALLVVMALLMALFAKSKIRHPSVILRGVAMAVILFGLIYINFKVFDITTAVPSDSVSASVIAY